MNVRALESLSFLGPPKCEDLNKHKVHIYISYFFYPTKCKKSKSPTQHRCASLKPAKD